MRVVALKDKAREDALLKSRSLVAMVIVLLLVTVLVGRLFYLQVIDHAHYTTLSHNNRVKIIPVAPIRGLIRDRNGVVLAQNQPSFSLEIIPEAVDDMDATLEGIAGIVDLRESDLQRFLKLRKHQRRFESIPLRLHLSDEEVARFAVNRHRFPGVDIEARLTRHYPLKEIMAHVVGYVGRINEQELDELDPANYSASTHIGKTGVEKAYETLLHGTVGYQNVETNAQGRVLRVLQYEAPRPGSDLQLHIDAGLQRVAMDALGEERGSVVAIDPSNGGVLALASAPGFDPNLFVHGIDPAAYSALRDSPDRPMFNRALRGQYPPGSTIKPFMGLAGLEFEIALAKGHTWCPGWYQLPGKEHKYRDWKRGGHGKTDLNWAIQRSCDVYFYQLAEALGIDNIHAFLSHFGFGQRTGLDIGGDAPGLLPSREWKRAVKRQPWYPGETLITGIGQGFNLATPLQLAVATAMLASHGHLYRPQVVDSIVQPASDELVPLDAVQQEYLPLKNHADWDTVIQGMIDVVHATRGTAHAIGIDAPYLIAGKTGTAQVFGIGQEEKYNEDEIAKRLRDHALFVAFAPARDPRIAVAVVVENGGGGSRTAAPIARKVMDYYLTEKLDVMPDTRAGANGGNVE